MTQPISNATSNRDGGEVGRGLGSPAPPPHAVDAAGVTFWLLVGMAVVVLAPCVLLPVWREYQALCYAEQVEQARVVEARATLERERRRLTALRSDPSAIARVARRELGYREPGEVTIPVSVAPAGPIKPAAPKLVPVEPPAAIARLVEKLPETNYDRLFCAGSTRTILMCLAGGLILAAFLICSPRHGMSSSHADA